MKLIAGLILFLFGSLAATAAPSAPPAPPKPKPLLLLSPFTGEKLVVRANVASVQANILSVEAGDGRKSGWDRAALVSTLPWYTDAELASREIDLAALVNEYDRAAREHPEFRAGLANETARVQTSIAALARDRQEKLAAVFSFRYDPAASYTTEADGRIDLLANAPTPAPVAKVTPPPPPPTSPAAGTPTPPPAPIHTPPPPSATNSLVAEATPEPENDKADLPPLSASGVNPGSDNTFYNGSRPELRQDF